MFVLSKKRISLIIICLAISIFVSMFSTKNSENSIETVSLPVSGKTIVIDAGHPRYLLTR